MMADSSTQLTSAQKDELMDQVKQQIAIANAQELLTDMTKKCFSKCIVKPGSSIDNSEQHIFKVIEMANTKKNLCAVLYGIDDIRLEMYEIPEVGDTDVLLEMYCTGICGSDVHYWKHGRIGDFVLEKPMIIGHESSGTVIKTGRKVKHLQKGDRVAIEPGVPCRLCSFCTGGKYNLCPEMAFCATPPIDGNLCRYYIHDASFCFKIPDHVSLEEAACIEPLSVTVHAGKMGHITIGSKVLIMGCGPIGLCAVMTAKAMGASKVIVTDIQQKRLETASQLGADYCILVKTKGDPKEIAECVKKTLGDYPDVTLDCSGHQSTIQLGLLATKAGGHLIIIGMGQDKVELSITAGLVKEITISGIFRYCNDYQDALNIVAAGKIDLKRLITHKYKIEDTVAAFERAFTGEGDPIKILIYSKADVQL
ncbi:hypothetical protein PGB90_009379 [Kerria lacca]